MSPAAPASPSLPAVLASGKSWLVLDKPAGLAVHPGPRTPHSLEQLLPAFAAHNRVPQPVHRLDRDTSGCLLLGRRDSAVRSLSRAFADGLVAKTYLAIVEGALDTESGTVTQALAKRSSREAGWRMVPDPAGQSAETAWRLLARQGPLSLIEFRPRTGRTHQIRVHATLLGEGTAIVGDPVYGTANRQGGGPSADDGLLLHAHRLSFPEPQTGERISVESPMPPRFGRRGFG